MKKNKIMSIGLFAILGLSIISFLPVNFAYAQQEPVKITGLGHNILEVHYQESTGTLWALGGSKTGTTVNLLEIDPVANTLTNTYNITSSANGGSPWDLWCGVTACYITTRTSEGTTPNSSTGAIIRVSASDIDKGTVENVLNATAGSAGFGRIDGRDSTSTGIGGIALYVESYGGAGPTIIPTIVGGLGTMSITAQFSNIGQTGDSGDGSGAPDFGSHDLMWTGQAGSDGNYLLISYYVDSANQERLFIGDLSNISTECTGAAVSVSPMSGGGQIIYDSTNSVAYVASGSNGHYSEIEIPMCTVTDDVITDDNTGLSDSLTQKSGIALPDRDGMFFQESGANARISTAEYDFDTQIFITNGTAIEITPNSAQPARYGHAYYAIEHNDDGESVGQNPAVIGSGSTAYNGIFIPIDNDEAIFIYKFQSPSEPEEVTGIDCSLPQNLNILICRLTDTTGGNIGGLGGILDSGLFNLFTNSGLIDGSDNDPKTNGIGYFITITGFGVMTAMFFIATKGRLNEVPTFIWMLSAIALLGAITAIGWLEPTFLIIGIISIIALASMQIRNTIDRGLDFGGSGNF